MKKEEVLQYILEPWYLASKEEAETYLRSVGIDPEESKKEFLAFIRSTYAGIELKVKPPVDRSLSAKRIEGGG